MSVFSRANFKMNTMNKPLRSLLILALTAATSLPAFGGEPKRIIICSVTTGFRHSSIAIAEKTLQKLGEESGAYTIVDFVHQPSGPKDQAAEEMKKNMEKLSPASLVAQKIDGVIFANTTGDLPLPDRDGFIKWIEDGHAFMAMHSGSDTFHGFPGYNGMLQGEFSGHGAQVPADLVAGDAAHPANGGIGATWNLQQEEMYHIKNQDRSKVRVLWFMRHDPNKVEQLGYFAVSWCRMAGKGHVFYTTLGHREDLWTDDASIKDRKNTPETSKHFQAHILGGIKWALGLSDGSSEPNPDVK